MNNFGRLTKDARLFSGITIPYTVILNRSAKIYIFQSSKTEMFLQFFYTCLELVIQRIFVVAKISAKTRSFAKTITEG